MRKLLIALAMCAAAVTAAAQTLPIPPSGDNQKSSVTQHIGPVRVTIDYSSPDVHGPNGEDRRGKIWGQLVPWGFSDDPFGTCTQCPWRAGANQNTVFTVSHDVEIEGQKLPAGSYGLFMAPGQDQWTIIFSKNHTSWGHYYYDPAEDALRVTVKPSKSDYNEWLTYEFTDRRPDRATVALKWEDLQVPFTISVPDVTGLHIAEVRKVLRSYPGFQWQNWNAAAQYALEAKRLDDALFFARTAAGEGQPFTGEANFATLSTLADVQQARGMTAEAKASRDKAFAHQTATAVQIHQYARALLQQGHKEEAIRAWELNAKRYPNQWPVNVGLMRAHSAAGRYKEALKYAKLALAQAPDDANKTNLQRLIKMLEEGKDING
jgi:tetratricopeptide (TPR) repeat protein